LSGIGISVATPLARAASFGRHRGGGQRRNVAALTNTINTVIWGDTGIVVGGIPIADAAAFQQRALAAVKRGAD